MKRATRLLIVLALAAAGLIRPAASQQILSATLQYDWPAATTGTAGQLGQWIGFNATSAPRPGNYTVSVTVTGTAPATCTFRVEGSDDASTWFGLDVTSPSTQSCTSNFMESITERPVRFLRINLTYTQGDATTSVKFHYTGGRK